MDNVEVIKFYADWCMPCRVYAKTFDRVVEKLAVASRAVNIDTEPSLKEAFRIERIPTTVVLVNGDEKRRHVGPMLHRDLTHMISEVAE